MLSLAKICFTRFATVLYTPEGKQIIERLWDETVVELKFADVQGILRSMNRK